MKHFATSLLAIVLLLLVRMPVAGQTSLALTGGVNIASVDVGDDSRLVPDFQSVTRNSLGLAADFPLSESWGLQLGGRYSQKGGRADFTEDGLDGESTIELDYLEFTALGRLRLPLAGDHVFVQLLTGPAVAVDASCEVSFRVTDGTGTVLQATEGCDQDDDIKRSVVDLGWALGGSLEIGITENLSAHPSLLYIHGIVDIDSSGSASMKHRVLTPRIGLAYAIW